MNKRWKDSVSQVRGFHAHVYYDEHTYHQARTLCKEAAKHFPIRVGRFYKRPVGPHPQWSCQLAFERDLLGDVILWLALNRTGLTIFIHAETGDDLKDHTDHAMWMGTMEKLNLSVFKRV